MLTDVPSAIVIVSLTITCPDHSTLKEPPEHFKELARVTASVVLATVSDWVPSSQSERSSLQAKARNRHSHAAWKRPFRGDLESRIGPRWSACCYTMGRGQPSIYFHQNVGHFQQRERLNLGNYNCANGMYKRDDLAWFSRHDLGDFEKEKNIPAGEFEETHT